MAILTQTRVPVFCNVLHETRAAALAAPAAEICLTFEPACGLIRNAAFDPALVDYQPAYENALHFSPRFRQYAEQLADHLVRRYRLAGKRVIDIGCGDGHFLALLCERGENTGLGLDPGHDPGRAVLPQRGQAAYERRIYTPDDAGRPVDLLTCRHVLEHLSDPLAFLQTVREHLARHDAAAYIEVPNALYTLRDMGIWDIIYEHCNYFTPTALVCLCEQAGLEVIDLHEAFDGQFLGVELVAATARRQSGDCGTRLSELVRSFAARYRAKLSQWRSRLDELRAAGRRAVVWGAGSKGVTFVNVLHADRSVVTHLVDISPRKAGRYVPLTGQRVVSPQELARLRPDVVVLMNLAYRQEVAAQLAELGVSATLLAA